jgi:hypothetical protein
LCSGPGAIPTEISSPTALHRLQHHQRHLHHRRRMSSSLTSSSSLSSPPSLRAGDVGYTEITPPLAVPLARRGSHSSLAYELRIRVLQLAQSGGWRTCPGGLLSCPESHVVAPNAGPIGLLEGRLALRQAYRAPSAPRFAIKRDCALNSAAIPLLRRG